MSPKPNIERRYLAPKDAAAYLGVSVRTLDGLPVKSIRLGHRTVRYDVRDLDTYMQSRKEDAA